MKFRWLSEYQEENKDATSEELIKALEEKYDLSLRQSQRLFKQYEKAKPSEYQIVATEPIQTTHAEAYPHDENSLKAYIFDKVTSPRARGERIDALVDSVQSERGVARIKAIEVLDELTADMMEDTGQAEYVFIDVYDEMTKSLILEAAQCQPE